MKKKKWNYQTLLQFGVPSVLIPGLLLAFTLGWDGNPLTKAQQYNQVKSIFPYTGTVINVYDGDTFSLKTGNQVRLLGVNAPDRGSDGYAAVKAFLEKQLSNKQVFLEYDRYQDDKYGRILAWVWINCEARPKFLPAEHMHDSNNRSKPGLKSNPEGCKEGTLINELLAKQGYAQFVTYKDRSELKYQRRIEFLSL